MTDTEDFAALMGEFDKQQAKAAKRAPKVGEKVKGVLVSIQGESAFVDLGAKTEGIVDIAELSDDEGNLTVGVGDTIEVLVSGKDEDTGSLLLGSQHARRMRGVEGLQQAYEQQLPVEGHVTAKTKGGIEIEISGVRAFCPASQVDIAFVEDLEMFVGQHLAFRITKFEGGKHPNLVVSRRALLEEERQAQAVQTRAQLEEGAVLKGKISSIKDFGAFVDLGGLEGMVHISELSFGRVEHPQEVVSVGQEVEVSVLRIEKTDNPKHPERIALSIRALEKDPWKEAAERFPVGVQVQGVVSRVQPFGAFVELAPGIDGLVHISELGAERRVNHPQEVVSVGQAVQATVLGVDLEKKRISLTLDAEKQSDKIAEQQKSVADYSQSKQSFGTLGDLLKESMEKQKR
jgi:small subunit ribosomal protein S1